MRSNIALAPGKERIVALSATTPGFPARDFPCTRVPKQ
jgi:hypothetical protein